MTKAAKSKLVATIERAWAGTPPPPEGQITAAAKRYDDSAELEKALQGRHWRDVSHETVYTARLDLSLLSPEGLRYYLPAWLLAALEDEQIRVFLLSYFEVGIGNGTLAKALPCFSEAERAALHDFFEYMAATDEEDWRMLAAAIPATGG